jgi:putative salt-induced outer membrane protein
VLFQVSPTVAVSNDTDLITSDDATTATNDLALTVAVNETISLRTNLLTEYDSDPGEGFEEVDNTLGAAVVFNF